MFKKYYIDEKSNFHKILLSYLIEPKEYLFKIEGLSSSEKKKIFNINEVKLIKDEIDLSKVTSKIRAIYLEEDSFDIKAIAIEHDKKYFLFKLDPQKANQLNIHQKYISNNLEELLLDFEKHSKTKGKTNYSGVGEFLKIKDLDYLDHKYINFYNKPSDKQSNLYRLIFNTNNNFTVDFVYRVKNKIITIVNEDEIDAKALTLLTMDKQHTNRLDCLFIDSINKDIKYFIFTYRPNIINHYYLLKNLGNDKFQFILEDISFNKVLSSDELKDLTYKKASEFATKEFAKMKYDNFFNEYVAFEEEEEIEEEVIEELKIERDSLSITPKEKDEMFKASKALLDKYHYSLDIALTTHGKTRMLERIGKLNDNDLLTIAKVAYERGKNSVSYLMDNNETMFAYLGRQQSRYPNKTLRIYENVLFVYSLTPPHELITCFAYKGNFKNYLSNKEKYDNKHKTKKKKK